MTTTRIIFEAIGHDENTSTIIQIEAPGQDLPDVRRPLLDLGPHQAVLDPFFAGQAGEDNIVAQIGDTLWQCLSLHENAEMGFHSTLNPGATDRKIAISFKLDPRDAKSLPWEALRVDGEFLCFDKRVPIVREVDSAVPGLPLDLASDERLRFLAVIGARGDDGLGEWNALVAALKSVAATLPLDVLLFSFNNDLLQAAKNITEFSITTRAIPSDPAEFLHNIESFMPHIAHFFCHGHAEGFLEIEPSGNQWTENPEVVEIKAIDLETALLHSAYLLVLNACSLAGHADDESEVGSMSLCEDLVDTGFPMVVGMRAPVNAANAERFARNFHRNSLRAIERLLGQGGGAVDLSLCFGDACRSIVSNGAAGAALSDQSWTLPIMHQRPEPPILRRINIANHGNDQDAQIRRAEKQAELVKLRAVLQNPPAAYLAHLEAILARVVQLEQELLNGDLQQGHGELQHGHEA